MAKRKTNAIHVRCADDGKLLRELERAWKASGITTFSEWVRVVLALEARRPRVRLKG